MKTLGIKRWTLKAQDRKEWTAIVRESKGKRAVKAEKKKNSYTSMLIFLCQRVNTALRRQLMTYTITSYPKVTIDQ
jgi:hypothetical protein